VVFVDTAAMLNVKRGCNLSGRPVETVGLATFAYSTVYLLIGPYRVSVWLQILLFEVHMRGHTRRISSPLLINVAELLRF
jgi:hypothetical protein